MSYHIPFAYTELEIQFLKYAEKHKKVTSLTLKEYYRKGWTYHAKGVWFYKQNSFMTLVGSPNLGYRSVNRDLESQVLIVSDDPQLLDQFKNESDSIQSFSSPVTLDDLCVKERRSALWVRLVLDFVKKIM